MNSILVNDLHCEKHHLPIEVTEEGKFICFKE